MWVEFFGRFVGGGGGCYIFIHHDIKTYTFLTTIDIYIITQNIWVLEKYIFDDRKKLYTMWIKKGLVHVHLIILGNKSLSDDENVKIFKAVHTFIQNCGRFN